jgi:hypothetical protein
MDGNGSIPPSIRSAIEISSYSLFNRILAAFADRAVSSLSDAPRAAGEGAGCMKRLLNI